MTAIKPLFDGLTLIDAQSDCYRNIVSLRKSQDLYDDLTDSKSGWEVAIHLELNTKPFTYRSKQPIIDRPFEEAEYSNAIEYPFKNWSQTRYSDGSFGVWYGTDALETSVYETVFHWRNGLLRDVGWENLDGIEIERKTYRVRCEAAILDFRPKLKDYPALIDKESYRYTQQVGARIHREGHPGLLSQSARCDGEIIAIFQQRVLTNPRHYCYLNYRTESGQVVIERKPGKEWFRID